MNHKQVFQGALLLTLVGLFSKVLSAFYRVPLQNMTGDEGIYIYQQIYPFIMIAIMLALYGYPAAISKVTSEKIADTEDKIFLYVPIFILLFMINGLLFLLLYFGAGPIAKIMGDKNLTELIQTTAYLYLLIPFTAFLRGGFQSMNEMRPTAVSQSVEQVIRVGFILLLTYLFVEQGKNLYEVGYGTAIATILAIIGSLLSLLLFALYFRKKIILSFKMVSVKRMATAIFTSGMIVALNYMILIFFQMVDNLTMIPGLMQSGLTLEEAKIEKGIFDRAQPLVQLGMVFGSSLSLALIPSIHHLRKSARQVANILAIQRVLKFTLVFSLAATIGLILIMPSLNIALFKTNAGTEALSIYVLMTAIMSITLTLSTLLQGFEVIKAQVWIIGITLGLKWILNMFFLPIWGILGGAISTVCSGLFLAIAFSFMLKQHIHVQYRKVIQCKPLFFGLIGMALCVISIKFVQENFFSLHSRLDHFLLSIVCSIVGALIFFLIFIKGNGFTKEELADFPFGATIIRLFKL
jgi:O-antigen/teichoic acid export membrane protein